MDRNPTTALLARRVSLAIREAGADVRIVASAADITPAELEDRLSGRVEFQLGELCDVGGFLRIPVTHFIEEAA